MTGVIEKINNDVVIVVDRDQKTTLAFRIVYDPENFAIGESVTYRELWNGGWEGMGAEITDSTGKKHIAHQALYINMSGTAGEIAAELNLDEDEVALSLAGVRRSE